ncbi:hypothetical protein IWZ01DRAFT_480487 [Phyllosticta capitalensis]
MARLIHIVARLIRITAWAALGINTPALPPKLASKTSQYFSTLPPSKIDQPLSSATMDLQQSIPRQLSKFAYLDLLMTSAENWNLPKEHRRAALTSAAVELANLGNTTQLRDSQYDNTWERLRAGYHSKHESEAWTHRFTHLVVVYYVDLFLFGEIHSGPHH